MGFKRKIKRTGGNSDFDKVAWKEWYQHLFETFPLKKVTTNGDKKRKTRNIIGVLNYIQDLGTPPAPMAEWKVKEDWVAPKENEEYSDYEIEKIEEARKKGQSIDFIWAKDWDKKLNGGKGGFKEVRKQTSFQYPKQQYGVCVDFPSWVVDFSKHPMAKEGAEEDKRAMRISLNGVYQGKIQRNIFFETDFRSGEVSDTNLLRKIAIAADLDEELKAEDWDIGILAGATCNFKVTADLSIKNEGDEEKERVYWNASVSTPSAVEPSEDEEGNIIATAEKKIEKTQESPYLADFCGMLLDMDPEDFTEDLLSMIHSTGNTYKFNDLMEQSTSFTIKYKDKETQEDKETDEMGIEFEGSNFEKAYTKYLAKIKKEAENEESEESSGKKSEEKKGTKPKTTEKVEEKEPEVEEKETSTSETEEEFTEENSEPPVDYDDDLPF